VSAAASEELKLIARLIAMNLFHVRLIGEFLQTSSRMRGNVWGNCLRGISEMNKSG